MLKFRRSNVAVGACEGLKSVVTDNSITLSGISAYDYKRNGNYITFVFAVDERRDLRRLVVTADGSPVNFKVHEGNVVLQLDAHSLPKKIALEWGYDEIRYPDVFNSEIEVKGSVIDKITNSTKLVTVNYVPKDFLVDRSAFLIPKAPLNFNKRLVITERDGSDEVVYRGAPPKHELWFKIPFLLDKLCYEDEEFFLDWYNSRGELLTERFVVKFNEYNVETKQLPVVRLNKSYDFFVGDTIAVPDLERKISTFQGSGEFSENGLFLDITFFGMKPDKVVYKFTETNNGTILTDCIVNNVEGKYYLLYVSPTITSVKGTCILVLEYKFGNECITHQIDITKLIWQKHIET